MIKQIPTLDGYEIAVAEPAAFTGGTENTRGDYDGTDMPHTLFQVAGEVVVRIFGVCTTIIASSGAPTMEVGVTGNTAALIAQTTALDIDANEIWSDSTPSLGVDTLASVLGPYIVANGLDILETIGTANITSGNIKYICLWKPISSGATVTALPIQEGADIRYDG